MLWLVFLCKIAGKYTTVGSEVELGCGKVVHLLLVAL